MSGFQGLPTPGRDAKRRRGWQLKNKVLWLPVTVLAFLLITILATTLVPWRKNTQDYFSFIPPQETIGFSVRYYPAPREWVWSGIFPFYGHLIGDPHINRSQMGKFQGVMAGRSYDFSVQLFEVNRHFSRPGLKQELLAVQDAAGVFLYHVPELGMLISGDKPPVVLGQVGEKVVVFVPHVRPSNAVANVANTNWQDWGVFAVLDYPFRSGHSVLVYSDDSGEKSTLLRRLIQGALAPDAVSVLCESKSKVQILLGAQLSGGPSAQCDTDWDR